MFFHYPQDFECNGLGYQYFYGPGILVAPVTVENSTTTDIYLPDDLFYDWYTHDAIRGKGSWVTLTDVPYTQIPLYYKGGSIIAQRANSSNTTAELRKQDFEIVIAPGIDGTASGSLYLDDGISIVQPATSFINFTYEKNGKFSMTGTFGYNAGVSISSITVLGKSHGNKGQEMKAAQATASKIPLTGPVTLHL